MKDLYIAWAEDLIAGRTTDSFDEWFATYVDHLKDQEPPSDEPH